MTNKYFETKNKPKSNKYFKKDGVNVLNSACFYFYVISQR